MARIASFIRLGDTSVISTYSKDDLNKEFTVDDKFEAEPDVRGKMDTYRFPIVMAAALGKDEIVMSMLEKGVDPKVTARDGKTPLHYDLNWRTMEKLIEKGADVNASAGLYTPLYYAIQRPKYNELAILLAEGADLTRLQGPERILLMDYAIKTLPPEDPRINLLQFTNGIRNDTPTQPEFVSLVSTISGSIDPEVLYKLGRPWTFNRRKHVFYPLPGLETKTHTVVATAGAGAGAVASPSWMNWNPTPPNPPTLTKKRWWQRILSGGRRRTARRRKARHRKSHRRLRR